MFYEEEIGREWRSKTMERDFEGNPRRLGRAYRAKVFGMAGSRSDWRGCDDPFDKRLLRACKLFSSQALQRVQRHVQFERGIGRKSADHPCPNRIEEPHRLVLQLEVTGEGLNACVFQREELTAYRAS
jgi:hypothetical protein